ncbi:uncharacterized protein K452DRAFT_78294 [Aplosporella prunicola CBS 121167]|uniref:Uncharacterized protein n=1 Tax=Aplosporella prunicola CBS 121167 TaxID=1176127 RepID=A0A6A6B3Z3_9PEZI|nr:uncharacterized protein K452DRAFT_78294 [Aplosporella prunicola CBS 121167]KAF2138939.1 hypothetical protein K452DRAFT_78294 [Aplosporella prunicola CBS 121167]
MSRRLRLRVSLANPRGAHHAVFLWAPAICQDRPALGSSLVGVSPLFSAASAWLYSTLDQAYLLLLEVVAGRSVGRSLVRGRAGSFVLLAVVRVCLGCLYDCGSFAPGSS